MHRTTFGKLALLLAMMAALVLAGCGGDDGGLSATDQARLATAETGTMEAQEELGQTQEQLGQAQEALGELRQQLEALRAQLAEAQEAAQEAMMDDDAEAAEAEETIQGLRDQIADLEGRVDEEGTTTDPGMPTTGPQADIGVDHVEGLTDRAGGVMFTTSPIAARIMPENYLSSSYTTSRRHHGVAFVNGVAPIGFAGRQNLADEKTYGAWMEYNHFGIFQGTGDDGDAFTDVWSIGARSGSNPTGGALTWEGAFVGEETTHAPSGTPGAMGNRMRGKAEIEVILGDAVAGTFDRAWLTISEIENIDNTGLGTNNPPYVVGAPLATSMPSITSGILPITGGMFSQTPSSAVVAVPNIPNTTTPPNNYGVFAIMGSFYGAAHQEAGGRFSVTDSHFLTDPTAEIGTGNTLDMRRAMSTYNLIGAFGVDRVGN